MSLPRGTLTATWQFAVFPKAPQNCRAMPTEACPYLGKLVSSRINTASGNKRSSSIVVRADGSGAQSHGL